VAFNGILYNDEKIMLTNTSVNLSACPSCFTWDFYYGYPEDLVVNEVLGTATFSYSENVFEPMWILNYTDETGACTSESVYVFGDDIIVENEILGCTQPNYLEYWYYTIVSVEGVDYYYVETPINEWVDDDGVSCQTELVVGCIYDNYTEYNPMTNVFDVNLCQTIIVYGCTDDTAFNYSIVSNTDDDSCYPVIEGCMDQTAFNYIQPTGDVFIDINTSNQEMCIPVIYGCLDPEAYNFNDYDGDGEYNLFTGIPSVDVNTDDGSCIERVYGCLDNDYVEYNDLANTDDGSCQVLYSVAYAEVTQVNINLNNTIDEATTSLSSLQQALDTWNTTIDLSAGWNMFGYGCPNSIDVADGLSNHTESIIITKDNSGNVYMPEFGFNGIGDFTPGFGYQIKLTEAIEGFSLCDWYVNDIPEDNIVSLQDYIVQLEDSIDNLNTYQLGDLAEGGIVFQINIDGTGMVADLQDLGEMDWDDALDAAASATSQGYEDWYLPSIEELELMYNTTGQGADNSGNFEDDYYWSSSEINSDNAWEFSFINGSSYFTNKYITSRVRVIRSF